MAYDLKLQVFTISLREKNRKDSSLKWETFIKLFSGRKYEKKFETLFTEYIKHFDGKFTVYKNWNKGISLGKNAVTFGSLNNFVVGKIEGGTTDISSTIKKQNNVEDEGFKVTRDHVNSIPFYFLIWLPPDSNKGLLIIQSIGDKSIHDPFKYNFKKFIENKNEKLYVDFNEHITEGAIKKMKEKGRVRQLILRRSCLPSDKAEKVFNKKYNIIDELSIEIRISGFGNSTAAAIKDYLNGNHPDLLELRNMKEIGMDSDYEILATLQHNGKTATAKVKTDMSLSPVYYIDSTDVPLTADNHPDEKKIKEYLQSFLSVMKTEMGFKD